jgi:proline racemase
MDAPCCARSAWSPIGEAAKGVLTEVSGTAFLTGEHRFVLDPRDPLGTGFVPR